MKKFGFTLAEVLITLAIIGVVAAITIPSVVANTQQKEFQTALRKAVSVLNSAITMNMAIDGESPYDNKMLPQYLMRHMSVLKSTTRLPYFFDVKFHNGGRIGGYDNTNFAFYTTDGMRFETDDHGWMNGRLRLHESGTILCVAGSNGGCGGCGSYGLNSNPNNTTKPPCLVMVDVNGDRKPSPSNVNCNNSKCQSSSFYLMPNPTSKTIADIFGIMITEDRAIPFGVVAQKAMYQAQK